ncbi:MAG: 50S ribosomal protein L20 [Candidatus Eisenbacteria bacterium]
MSRAQGAVPSRARRKRVLKASKGAFHGRRKLYRTANENVWRGLNYAYRDRKVRKRMMRTQWIQRINAAARIYGLSYNQFIDGLKKAAVLIDRKMLSDLAVHDLEAFGKIVETAKQHAK